MIDSRHLLSLLVVLAFAAAGVMTSGPADMFVNSQIEAEKDPIKREKRRRYEEYWITHNKNPGEKETAKIDREVDRRARLCARDPKRKDKLCLEIKEAKAKR